VRRRISTEDEIETERWLREVALVGSPETMAGRIAALREELGFGNLMLVTGFRGNLPQEHVATTLELFAEEVMPRFRPTLAPVESCAL
jgi:alkanesulfonate monooxygenase SsuD/methylene tetrahydromethanopterin reductase-like flavin-dependent oxidoreductase (luciferase family)